MPPSDVTADEPPAKGNIQEVAAEERVIPTVQKLCAADKLPVNCSVHKLGAGVEPPANGNIHEVAADEPPVIPTVQELCAADKPPANYSVHELDAGNDPPAIGRVPDLCAADAPQKGNVSRDINNEINHHNSENENIIEDLDQTFHGNVSEVEGPNVDFTETKASDGMLLDGIRKLLQKSDERKQKRSVLKEQSRKRSRAQMGRVNERLNKGRAAAYSRFSIAYFAKIVDSVCKSNSRMELVKNCGFGYLLEVDDYSVPMPFAQWITDNVNMTNETIVLRGKPIPLNAEAVSLVLGIPTGSIPISTAHEEIGKLEFLSLFGLTEVPSISFFGNKLMTEDPTDDEYIRCFLTVALATFLCPTSNNKPSTKYMGALVDVSNLKNLNWCSFVHGWTMCYVKKYQQQTEKEKEERITTTLGSMSRLQQFWSYINTHSKASDLLLERLNRKILQRYAYWEKWIVWSSRNKR